MSGKKKYFTNEQINDICNLYKNGWCIEPIAEKYGCSRKPIIRTLKENNIEIRLIGDKEYSILRRKYDINDNYFALDKQTSNSAYILGLIASDGCIEQYDNSVYIELQRIDREILEKVNLELENQRPVQNYINYSKNTENSKIYFYSKQIREDLANYNLMPDKTHKIDLDFTYNIKPEYLIDYIRGHFDGDGSIKWTNGCIQWQIDSTSLNTLKSIQNCLLKQYGIRTTIKVHKEPRRKMNLYRIYFYGYENALKLYKLFYETGSNLYLKRKQEKYLQLLLKYKTHETSHLLNKDEKIC